MSDSLLQLLVDRWIHLRSESTLAVTLPGVKYFLIATGSSVLLVASGKLFKLLRRSIFSPLLRLPGNRSSHWLWGDFQKRRQVDDPVAFDEERVAEYGTTIMFHSLFRNPIMYTLDPKAINHVFNHSNDYPKPDETREGLSRLIGPGVLVTEGEQHRNQRRIMNPAFGPVQIRELTHIFVHKALQLRNVWNGQLPADGAPSSIDVFSWLNRATLDIIGLAGFGYEFDSLEPGKPPNELNEAFSTIFGENEALDILSFLKIFVPPLRLIKSNQAKRAKFAQKTMRRIGLELIAQRKAAVTGSASGNEKILDRSSVSGRDLLSLLVRANLASDLPDSQRMSDEDVLAQIPTFLVAGHETTSSAVSWALFALSQHRDVQRRLREELLEVQTDTPDMDELQKLPFLDAVVRETLRLHAPVSGTARVAMKDDIIPLATPYVDTAGVERSEVTVTKGDPIIIPIQAMNRAKSFWGEDAVEFRPERWEQPIPSTVSAIPGVWAHLLTFISGSHACIGYRFSLVEMKALLFTLVRSFEFELDLPADKIVKRSVVITRPAVRGEKGNRLPLLVKQFNPVD